MFVQRLAWKFIAVLGLAYVVFAAIALTLCLRWERERLAEQTRAKLDEIAQLVADEATSAESRADLPGIVGRVAEKTGSRVTLLSDAGEALADSAETGAPLPNQSTAPEIRSARRDGWGLATRSNPNTGDDTIYFARKVASQNSGLELVRVGLPWNESEAWLQRFRNRLLALFAAGGALLGGTALALVRPLAQRAKDLARGADRLRRGDFSPAIADETDDELGLVARNLEAMRQEVSAQVDRLRKNSDRLTVVLSTMSEGVVALDNRAQILFANNAARALLEFATPEAVGRPLLEAVRNPAVQEIVEQAFAAAEPRTVELEIGAATRRIAALHTRRLPGTPSPGVLLVLHDVSDLRRLENLRQEFVANVSHELKTPLTIIKAFAETLLDGAINDQEHNVSFVRQIAEQAERLHQLILDLLSVARIESGDERFEFRPIELGELVEACAQRYTPAAEAKSVRLSYEACPGQLQAFADEEGLREIFDNLVDNAVKYTPQGGAVTIRCSQEQSMVRVDVSDTGIGIPADHQGRIFERFYRVDKARSRELGGTGLGLSIVKHLVAAMGGTVAVQSEPGKGSTFTVRLPRA